MEYVEFLIGPEKLVKTKDSRYECRNIGLLKIMTKVFDNLKNLKILKQEYAIKINTSDRPITSQKSPLKIKNLIEFNTVSSSKEDGDQLFPDYVFGNWSHIGLFDFDNFCKEICENNSLQNIKYNNLFWIGNTEQIPQRIKYLELCKQHPNIFVGEKMNWVDNGRQPTKFLKLKDHCYFKYLIDMMGYGWSGRIKLLPFCNRPLFVADREFWGWSDIQIIKQDLHIQVKEDLSDLLEKFNWAESNQSFVFERSSRLLDYCQNNLTFEKACDQATQIISESIKKTIKKISRPTIVSSKFKEDLNWLKNSDYPVFVVAKDPAVVESGLDHYVMPNKGREAGSFIWYICNFWDKLPDRIAFIHGHEFSYHQTKHLFDAIEEHNDKDFHGLNGDNCFAYHDLDFICRLPTDDQTLHSAFKMLWHVLLEKELGLCPEAILLESCAQFIVSKQRIKRLPLSFYESILDFIYSTEIGKSNYTIGAFFELVWHIIFGENPINLECNSRAKKVYDLCLKNNLNGFFKMPEKNNYFILKKDKMLIYDSSLIQDDIRIVSCKYNEDLEWLKKSKYPVTVVAKEGVKVEEGLEHFFVTNKGREAGSYLWYICNFWDNLPDRIAFIHGHEFSYHQTEHVFSVLKANKHKDFYGLNGDLNFVYHDLNFIESLQKQEPTFHTTFKLLWSELLEKDLGECPPSILFEKSAQFIVSKNRIKRFPLSFYKNILDFIFSIESKEVNYVVGGFLELIWHIIFGEDSINLSCSPYAKKVYEICQDKQLKGWFQQSSKIAEVINRDKKIETLFLDDFLDNNKELAIVSCRFKEDLNWLKTAKYPVVVVAKEGSDPLKYFKSFVIPNKAREAGSYLWYICKFWDDLPNKVAFIHGHENSLHQDNSILEMIDKHKDKEFWGLNGKNCVSYHDLTQAHPYFPSDANGANAFDVLWEAFMKENFGQRPDTLFLESAAQFIVSRDRIKRLPLSFYNRALQIICSPFNNSDELDKIIGIFFECTWHIIFGEPTHITSKEFDFDLISLCRKNKIVAYLQNEGMTNFYKDGVWYKESKNYANNIIDGS